MDAQREATALDLYEAWLDQPAAEREAWLRERCGGDVALETAVRRLATAGDSATAWLPSLPPEPVTLPPPARVGPWRLVRELGSGGMGTVYLGQRDDGLFEQMVAVKFIHPAAVSAATRGRFAEERRMLAALRHPHIATLLEGGTDAEGRSYLVMEYLPGEPLTDHARQHELGLHARLALFLQAARAVQHAHERLIIHADLKPANIVVVDGAVKLLDFGIARWLGDDGRARATADGVEPMTEHYAAPERRRGAPPDVAGDVYALGLVLAELVEPVARAEGLRRADLEAIQARATAGQPADRYTNVKQLVDDLQQLLEHRPVSAHAQEVGYLVGRFIRRHRTGLAITAVAMTGLAVAAGVNAVLYQRAERARVQTEERNTQLRSVAHYLLYDLSDALAAVPGTIAERERVAREAQQYLEVLSAQRGAPADVRLEAGAGLVRLALLVGVPAQPNMGDTARARQLLDRAILTLRGVALELPQDPAVARALGEALIHRGRLAAWADQKVPEARAWLAEARRLRPVVLREPGTALRQWEALAVQVQAEVEAWGGDCEKVIALATGGLATLDAWPAGERDSVAADLARTRLYNQRGDAHWEVAEHAAAIADYRRGDALLRRHDTPGRSAPHERAVLYERLVINYNLGTAYAEGQPLVALPVLDESVGLLARLVALEPRDASAARRGRVLAGARAQVLAMLGRHDEAITAMQGAVAAAVRREAEAPDDVSRRRETAQANSMLALVEWRARKRAASCAHSEVARARFEALLEAGQLSRWDQQTVLARLRVAQQVCAGKLPDSQMPEP